MTTKASATLLAKAEETPLCRHHWVIPSATGPVSLGTCQTCGAEREFKNYVEAGGWGETRSVGRPKAAHSESVAKVVADDLDDDEAD